LIDGLKPYPAMKDSVVAWLRQVPEHWELPRLKRWVANIIEQTNSRQRGDLYLGPGRLRIRSGDISFDSQVKRFQRNDVLFGKLRPYLAVAA
jgi:type I restriction enzyme, S subunit